MRAGFSYNLIIIIIGGGFGIIIIKVRHCWLRERKKQSHQERVLVYLSFFFFFFFKCPYFILCFSYYVVGTVPIELVMNLFLKKTKTSVIDFYIFFVSFFYFPVECERMKYHLEFRADPFRTRTKRFTHRHVWIARLENFFFFPRLCV